MSLSKMAQTFLIKIAKMCQTKIARCRSRLPKIVPDQDGPNGYNQNVPNVRNQVGQVIIIQMSQPSLLRMAQMFLIKMAQLAEAGRLDVCMYKSVQRLYAQDHMNGMKDKSRAQTGN